MAEIVTLTLNPCVDRTITGGKTVCECGGKGINVARVLSALGRDCIAVAPVGSGENSRLFTRMAAEEGIRLCPVPVGYDIRRIDTYRAEDNSQRVDYDRGRDANESDLPAFRETLARELRGARLLIVSGSAPGGVLAAFAAEAIRTAKTMGVETLLDSNGEALTLGFAAGPGLIKPNQKELGQLLDREIAEGEEEQAALRLLERGYALGLKGIVVSLGERGALWVREGGTVYCPAPKVDTINPVGSGDCFVAALCHALLAGLNDQWALAAACAAGAANAAVFPAARIGRDDIARLLGWSI